MAAAQPSPPRILVIRGGAIGDFLLTLPALRLLRQNLAACEIEVLGYPGIMDLAVKARLADRTRSLEHRSMALLFAKNAPLDPALVDYLCGFNLVVSYLYDPDGILRANLERIGVKTLLECPHGVQPGQGHAAQQLARPLEKLALWLEDPDWRSPLLTPTPKAATLEPRCARIALHPGSGSLRKNWPLERWQEVARRLRSANPERDIVIVTGEAEEARGLCAGWSAFPTWHGLPLTDLADRLGTCSAFLGHDSGISHLAAACGLPCLLLFGPTDPALWAPPQTAVQVLRAPEEALESLDVPTVETAIQNFLACR